MAAIIGGLIGGCLNSVGYTTAETTRAGSVQAAATIKSASATAIAALNAQQAVSNFRQQRDIARRSVRLARDQQNQLQNVFWPRELEFLAEFGNAEAIEQVEVMGRRYGGRLVAAAADKFAKRLAELRCSRSRYCTSANQKALQDLLLVRSETIAAMRVLGRNIAFTEYQIRSDTNYKRRMQAVALGRGLLADAARLLGQAAGNLSQSGAAALAGLNSALGQIGEGIQDYRAAGQQLDTARAQQAQASLPYNAPGSTAGFGNNMDNFAVNAVGLQSTSEAMSQLETGNSQPIFDSLLNSQTFQFSPNQGLQVEKWNEGRVGYNNLARGGTATFPVSGGSVTVDMSQFPLQYVDGYTEGEYGPPPSVGIP